MGRSQRIGTVLIVSDFADVTGGQAKVAIDSARLLADAGLRVHFFAACGPVSDRLDHPAIDVTCLNRQTILDDPNRLRAMASGIWNRAAATALRAVAARFDPRETVLHCHGYAKALSPAIGPVLAGGPLRSVFTLHEYFLACPNGGFFNYRTNRICTLSPLGPRCLTTNCDARRAAHKAWRVARAAVARGPGRLPRGLRDVICISDTQARAMAGHLPQGTRLHRVSNPVAAAAPPVDPTANRLLVYAGRLSREKGCVHLAAAARRLDMPVRFVGDGPEAAAIRQANPAAEITGWVNAGAVQQHLSQARAFVFPSLWYEGQPLAPLEALLRGVPVVCGRWTAAAEAVRDGQTGALYDAADADALAAAITRATRLAPFDTTDLRAAVSPERHRDRLIEIYDDILAR